MTLRAAVTGSGRAGGLATIFSREATAALPRHHGGAAGITALAQGAGSVTTLAAAFGTTFWAAVALTAAALIPALALPRQSPADKER